MSPDSPLSLQLDHPNVVKLMGVCIHPPRYIIVTELLRGAPPLAPPRAAARVFPHPAWPHPRAPGTRAATRPPGGSVFDLLHGRLAWTNYKPIKLE